MKGKQVRVVLAALLIVGLVGLVYRIVSSSENEVVLSGLSPLEREFIDRVVIRSPESEAVVEGKVIGNQKSWFVNVTDPVFVPKIDQFWSAVGEINEAGLIALNVDNHERMGVDDASGTRVEFYLGGAVQEQLIVGTWDQDVRLCYVRRSGQDAVYGIECPVPASSIFDPNADGWRNPIIASIPAQEVQSIVFSYPDHEFAVSLAETEAGFVWMAARPIDEPPGVEEVEANPYIVQNLLQTFQGLLATGFADDDEADELTFDAATPFDPHRHGRGLQQPNHQAQIPAARRRDLVRQDRLAADRLHHSARARRAPAHTPGGLRPRTRGRSRRGGRGRRLIRRLSQGCFHA